MQHKYSKCESGAMIPTYIEFTPKRTFAAALDWHGWARSGRAEAEALQALLDSAPRYARILAAAQIEFTPPDDLASFFIAERQPGNGTTAFGAPSVPPLIDSQPLSTAELARLQALLAAYWAAFDTAVESARGQELRKGPRGGGRNLDSIVEHVVGGAQAYLSELAWKWDKPKGLTPYEQLAPTRQAVAAALTAAAHGQTLTRKPRGSLAWSPRYFVRRSGWHILDHVWEIEDRLG
jgi:hypothetical protein